MDLTKRLWEFWRGLNEGRIDWVFLNSKNNPQGERDKAQEMVVSRGFVNVFDKDEFPKPNSGNWKVVCILKFKINIKNIIVL